MKPIPVDSPISPSSAFLSQLHDILTNGGDSRDPIMGKGDASDEQSKEEF